MLLFMFLAFVTFNLDRIEFSDTVETSNFGVFKIIHTEIFKGSIDRRKK
jgi:hypothetical protein